MVKSLKEIGEIVKGKVVGRSDISISGVSGIEEAKEGDITFFVNPKYLSLAYKTHASAILVAKEIPDCNRAMIIVTNPYLEFAKLINLFYVEKRKPLGIDKSAVIGENVKLGEDLSIYPLVVIDDGVEIGDRVTIMPGTFVGRNSKINEDTIIYPNVSVRESTEIGKRVIIHSGTSIGSDGFGFLLENGKHIKIPQVGSVVIEDDVEIGSNVSIDRATLGKTIIKQGTKIDNLVQIGHNVIIGENNILVSQVGISGSCVIGDNVLLAGQVGIADHVRIGDNVIVGAKSGVGRNLKANSIVSGAPAYAHNKWRRTQVCLHKLPEFFKKMRKLEKKILKLEQKLSKKEKQE